MRIRLLKAKLHKAAVTATVLDYHGSITIDEELMQAVGLHQYEAVAIGNFSNGQRAETYVIKGQRGSGEVQLNGAVARLAEAGDRLVILAYASLEANEVEAHRPKIAVLDERNRIVEQWEG